MALLLIYEIILKEKHSIIAAEIAVGTALDSLIESLIKGNNRNISERSFWR